jgi:uncharacterized radical SAM superfamily Fe-S cluster-containing enzyme
MKFSLRLLYLYLFSFVGLLITIIGSIQLIDLGLKTYVFNVNEYGFYPITPVLDEKGNVTITVEEQKKQQEMEAANQRKRQVSNSLAMILVGAPVYLYHWKTIKKEVKS